MLRECHRVLRPGGRLAVVSIESGPGLDDEGLVRAAEMGPAEVRAEAPLDAMVRAADFELDIFEDVTAEFQAVLEALLAGLQRFESELRAAEGDEEYDYEVGRRGRMLEATREGLIRRSFVAAHRR